MKRNLWRWLLPLVQLTFALACHVYDVHEYRMGVRYGSLEYYSQHSPAWAGRISRGINFPAWVLAYPLRDDYDPVIYQRNSEYTYIAIYPRDLGFFLAIIVFWHFVGRTLDSASAGRLGSTWNRKARVVGLACGVVFGVLTGAYGDRLIDNHSLSQREIGAFGIAWACVLIVYFVWRLAREVFAFEISPRWLFAGSAALATVALLWIGGPYGATQALGEYLRPTTARTMPVSPQCTTGETPPARLMRVVASETAFYHLSLQKLTVCSTVFVFGRDELDISKLVSDEEGRWLPVRAGCCTYQYRRHAAVIVGGVGTSGSVIVEADLIQSRWDYLKLNWNKMRRAWFWPYPRSMENSLLTAR